MIGWQHFTYMVMRLFIGSGFCYEGYALLCLPYWWVFEDGPVQRRVYSFVGSFIKFIFQKTFISTLAGPVQSHHQQQEPSVFSLPWACVSNGSLCAHATVFSAGSRAAHSEAPGAHPRGKVPLSPSGSCARRLALQQEIKGCRKATFGL